MSRGCSSGCLQTKIPGPRHDQLTSTVSQTLHRGDVRCAGAGRCLTGVMSPVVRRNLSIYAGAALILPVKVAISPAWQVILQSTAE